jgi:hypothetical protein
VRRASTPSAGARCYDFDVKKWLVIGTLIAIGAIVAAILLSREDSTPPKKPSVVDEFRTTERLAIAAFNTALRRQRANEIDELELANTIERDVLVPWRAMRSSVTSAPTPPDQRELFEVMRRYVQERDVAWQAYVDALRAPSDADARPLYDRYHEQNARAQDDARVLGGLIRESL